MNHASFFGILSSVWPVKPGGSPKVRCEYVYMHTHTLTLLHVCLNEELLSCQLQSCCLRHINFRYYEHIQTLIPLCPAGVCPCFEETPCRTAELPLQVLDYIPPGKFHQLARMCSIQGDTVHYGYSMNWVAPWLEQNEGILWEGPCWTWKHFGYCHCSSYDLVDCTGMTASWSWLLVLFHIISYMGFWSMLECDLLFNTHTGIALFLFNA